MRIIIYFALILMGQAAQGRVFSIADEKFASYFLLNGGLAQLQKTPFENESAAGVSFNEEYLYDWGGEFGFLYATPFLNFRFGFGIIKPPAFEEVKASNASGELYRFSQEIFVFTPKLGVEANFKQAANYRVYGVATLGQANLSMKSNYQLSSAGQSAFPGVSDHEVDVKSTANEWYGAVGGELHMTDTTTVLLEAGYRSLKFEKLSYSKSVTTFTGSQNSGDAVKDVHGKARALDFTGIQLTLGFRFYL